MVIATFVNHASVLIQDEQVGLLSDPWYAGSAFGTWSLMYENSSTDILNILSRTSHIWISHEHPDHFSAHFFKTYLATLAKNKIIILISSTRDRRLYAYLASLGLSVFELVYGIEYCLSADFKISISPSGLIDSYLHIQIKGISILNLNDCAVRSHFQLSNLAKKIGKVDLLMAQFSNASWKPFSSKSDSTEVVDARARLLLKQATYFKANYVLPFASFSYWSSPTCYYLNSIKTELQTIYDIFEDYNHHIIACKPGTSFVLFDPPSASDALTFWNNQIVQLSPKASPKDSFSVDQIQAHFTAYVSRLYSSNSPLLLLLLSLFIPAVKVHLLDQDLVLRINTYRRHISVFTLNARADVSLHSSNLSSILHSPFGYDTLIVGGDFTPLSRRCLTLLNMLFFVSSVNCYGYRLSFNIHDLFSLRFPVELAFNIMYTRIAHMLTRLYCP